MQRDDQKLINFYYKVCSEAAKRKMLVDFHGGQKQVTMTRTWPNMISGEGVRGMEWSKWSADSEPKHNVTLPFTRMFLGVRLKIDVLRTDPMREVIHIGLSGTVG